MKSVNAKEKRQTYLGILLVMVILVSIFLNSFYWPYREVDKRKIVVWSLSLLGVVVVPIVFTTIPVLYRCINQIAKKFLSLINKIKINRDKVLKFLCFVLSSVGISAAITYVISCLIMGKGYNEHLFATLLATCMLITMACFLWKHAAKIPEYIFLVIVLIVGIFSMSVTPDRVGVSWDDEIHYESTLEIANFLNGIMYVADQTNIKDYGENIYARQGYDSASAEQYTKELEKLYADKEWSAHDFSGYGVWSIAYIPAAIGIIIARGLGMSYVNVFHAGRLMNLLGYTFLIWAAIRRIKHGKVLIAAIGLIPTSIFMASSYSYDWWVTGFTILGFSYFFAELQEDKILENKNLIIMFGALILGCLPKATYFLMLFPLLFMPAKKFANSKQRKCYYFGVIGACVFLVSTFMLPLLINGAGQGDVRGGAEVNSAEQIKYILRNPLAYTKTLIKFELDYIALANSASMLQRFAYVGNGYFYSIISMMLCVLAFLDRGECEKNNYLVKGATLFGCAAAIILSTTALYISFTAVGLDTVAGMQARYMVPTILPALFAIGLGGTKHKINKNAFVCVPMLVIALTYIANMFKFCVLYY